MCSSFVCCLSAKSWEVWDLSVSGKAFGSPLRDGWGEASYKAWFGL